jgi:hypothetical protein
MKTLYVYRTHLWNKFCQDQYARLKIDLGTEDVFLLFDDTKNKFPEKDYKRWSEPDNHLTDRHFILNNFNECLTINPLHRSNKEQVESQLLLFYKLCNTEFDNLWLIEYDVFCDGNWKVTLESCGFHTEDFLASKVYAYHENILWNHWFGIYGPRRNKPMLVDRVGSFFPLVRISKKLLDALQKNINKYSGFCEVYIPTVAKQYGLTWGSFPSKMLSDSFFFDPLKTDCQSPLPLKHNNKLYHPVLQIRQQIGEQKQCQKSQDDETKQCD